jgi:hypothetical protein
MRWKFIDPTNQQEQAERAKIVANIDTWWQQFQSAAAQLDALFSNKPSQFQNSDQLVTWMHRYLHAVHPQLMWEFGPALKTKGHRLVITPEAARHLRPLTKALLKRAPQIPGWEFYQYRLPENVEATHQTIQARTQFDSSAFQVRMSRGQQNRIDLSYFAPNITSSEDQDALHAAFVATETLLGEELLDKWAGNIEIGPLKKSSALGSLFGKKETEIKHLIPLDRMKDTFDAVIESVRDQLPPKPHYAWVNDDTPGSLWKLKPQEADEYPCQIDLIVGQSINPAMWTAAHDGSLFFSERFTRCGETFCYLKIDGAEGLEGSAFEGRDEIEDALDALLGPAKLGCTIGGGTGIRYSYIDLALADLGPGIQAIRKVLRAAKIPKRTWIQFYDSDLAAEWVGIYDETPAPPLPNFDEAG